MSEQYAFRVAQVAAQWGVSEGTIYNLCHDGQLGHIVVGTRLSAN
jgi:excisionase family DNA binding protein